MSRDFDHLIRLDQIGESTHVELCASEPEREAAARRLGLPSIDRLEAHAKLSREGDCVHAEGRVQAAIVQECVITGDPIAAMIDEPFAIDFIPEPAADATDEEIELDPNDCDTVFHDGAAIDLGAAVADTLALSVDPYPRSASADSALKEAGVQSEEEAGPFGALSELRDKLGSQS